MEFVAQKKLKKLVEINARINSGCFDKDSLVRAVLESAVRLARCERVLLWLCDKNGGLCFSSELGKKREVVEFYASCEKLAERSAQTKSCEISNVSKYEVLTSPIYSGDECFAVLQMAKKSGALGNSTNMKNVWLLCEFAVPAFKNIEAAENLRANVASYSAVPTGGDGKASSVFVAKSRVMLDLLEVASQAAQTDAPVLVAGERGAGKQVLAEQIHHKSKRADGKFVRVNCAVLSDALAATDALAAAGAPALSDALAAADAPAVADALAATDALAAAGAPVLSDALAAAKGGTLFLDEVAALSVAAQKEVMLAFESDVRVIASTAASLPRLVEQQKFDAALYRRLSAIQINVPPLRAHKDDIMLLADFFLRKYADATNKNFVRFSDAAQKILLQEKWRGNVRELKNLVERACVVGKPPVVEASDICGADSGITDFQKTADTQKDSAMLKEAVDEFKKRHIVNVLENTNWNQTAAAKILGIQRTYLSRLMKELEIREH